MRKRFLSGEFLLFNYQLMTYFNIFYWRNYFPITQEIFYWLRGGLVITFLVALLGYFFYPRWRWSIWHLFFCLLAIYLLIFGYYALIVEKLTHLAISPEDFSHIHSYQTSSLWVYPSALIYTLMGYRRMIKEATDPQEDSLFGIKHLKK
ncbi:hypothetical protein GGG87_06985 [Streptococcus sp. zg-86]|uniref:Uncharacterized protein n=1 Tax=Streptococcus zhangguiae TaxID=2664091 RepID=A0A6I4RJV2_9STRE|nr:MULTISPECIES: hypothetical protein [unclassified Streptococcus]MTB64736.1 hypothetical protein [Streptococcus sp. zg-86]MTB91308.1 hypothetical protein [Streptococcus sp. zg-36]MTB91468.1 hypothetical protein [Streptococcus sp. zg-36]MWV56761.1 hypothetical protein [Streptococcus sp. zg-70]QTH48493.1 hypothetical protein J5M87_03985 [Streptococcus sp. zg-86]